MLFQQIQREERALEQKQQQLVQELSQVLQETQNKEEYLNRLVNDPSFRERVIREKLGHVRENETVYIFEE